MFFNLITGQESDVGGDFPSVHVMRDPKKWRTPAVMNVWNGPCESSITFSDENRKRVLRLIKKGVPHDMSDIKCGMNSVRDTTMFTFRSGDRVRFTIDRDGMRIDIWVYADHFDKFRNFLEVALHEQKPV